MNIFSDIVLNLVYIYLSFYNVRFYQIISKLVAEIDEIYFILNKLFITIYIYVYDRICI